MNELETRLAALAEEIHFPETPTIEVPAARTSTATHRRGLRMLAIACVVAVAALGAVLALSPGARSAFRELFRIGGAEVVRLEQPPAATDEIVPFGDRVTLAAARRAVSFPVRVPSAFPAPFAVYVDRAAGIVSLVRCCERRLVLSQFPSTFPGALRKLLGPADRVEPVEVDGGEGVWITGGDHVIRLLPRNGPLVERTIWVTGAVLLWERAGMTYRLEGGLTLDEALRIARSLIR